MSEFSGIKTVQTNEFQTTQLVWGHSMTYVGSLAVLAERCERITSCDEEGVSTIVLYADIQGERVSEYTDTLGRVWRQGDICSYPAYRLRKKVSNRGHTYWLVK